MGLLDIFKKKEQEIDPALRRQLLLQGYGSKIEELKGSEAKDFKPTLKIDKVSETAKILAEDKKKIVSAGPRISILQEAEKEKQAEIEKKQAKAKPGTFVVGAGLTPEETKRAELTIKEQPQPTPTTGGKVVGAAKFVGELAEDIARIPQKLVTAPLLDIAGGVASLITGKEIKAEVKPREGSLFDRIVLGKNPIKGFSVRVEEAGALGKQVAQAMNLSEDTQNIAQYAIAPLFVGASVALDVLPGGKGTKWAAKEVAKRKTVQEILPVLKRVFKTSDEELIPLAKSLVNVNNVDDVEKILNGVKKDAYKKTKDFYFKDWRGKEKPSPVFGGEIVKATRKGWEHLVKEHKGDDLFRRLRTLPEAKKVLEDAQTKIFEIREVIKKGDLPRKYYRITNPKYNVDVVVDFAEREGKKFLSHFPKDIKKQPVVSGVLKVKPPTEVFSPKKELAPQLSVYDTISQKSKEVKQVFRKEKLGLQAVEEERLGQLFKDAGLETRQVRATQEMIEQAKALDINDVMAKPAKQLTDAEVIRLRGHLSDINKELTEAIKAGQDLKVDLLQDEIIQVVKKLTVGGTELGRGVYAYKLMAENNLNPAFWLRRAQKAFGMEDLPKEIITKINEFIENKEKDKLAQYVANLEKSSWLNKIATLRTAGLLTGVPKTDAKNIVSNIILKNLEDLTDVTINRGLDAFVSLFTKKRATATTFGDILKTWGKFNEGARAGWDLLKTGVDKSGLSGRKYVYKKAFNRYSDNPIERNLAKYTDLVFNRLEAEDKPFKAMANAKYILERARLEGMREGKKGVELEKFIDDFIKNPSDKVKNEAIEYARYMTLQSENLINDLWRSAYRWARTAESKALTKEYKNKVAKRIGIELASIPSFVMQMISPFNRVATNLIIRPLEFSPAGFLNAIYKGVQGNQEQAVKSAGRAMLGTLMLGGLYSVYKKGWINFESPELTTEKKMTQLKYRIGKSPYNSITVKGIDGKTYNITLSGIDPLPKLFLGAGLIQQIDEGKITFADAMDKFSNSLLDETYTKGIQDIINMKQYGSGYIKNFLGKQGASFVPTIVYSMSRAFDNNIRLTGSITEEMLNRIPFVRNQLPPRFDAYGHEEVCADNPFLRIFNEVISPIKISQVKYNRIDKELEKLYKNGQDVLPNEQARYIRSAGVKIEFAAEELSKIQRERGRNLWTELNKLILSSDYRTSTQEEKTKMIQDVYSDNLTFAKEKIIANIVRNKDIDPTGKVNYLMQIDEDLGMIYYKKYRNQVDLKALNKSVRNKIQQLR